MMNRIKRHIVLVLILLTGGLYAQQSDCAIKLDEAENLYEMGELDSIPSLLRECVREGFDNEELSRAYKLLIRTYLFEDFQEMAELTMLKFLKKFPEYEIKANDPVEFKYLYNSYKTIPVFSIGVIGGINYSFVRIIEPYSLSNTEDYSGEYSVSTMGYHVGLQLKKYITDEIEINVDGIYSSSKFDYSLNQLESNIEYSETQVNLSFPISGTYDFKLMNFRPFVRLGVSIDYMISSNASLNRSFVNNSSDPLTGPDIDMLENRNTLNFSLLAGGGIKYDLKKNGYLMFDLRYYFGLTNNVNADNRYSNDELIWYYNYIDDNFSVNRLLISVGFVYPIYKTKNIK